MIDALRMDFVKPDGQMSYVNRMLETGDACMIKIHVQTPTVTLPRVKVGHLLSIAFCVVNTK